MHDLNWSDFRLLHEIGRAGSLSGAAVSLRVNQSTVSRRLSGLERQLGCRLVDRSVAGAVLTEAGVEMYQLAEQIAQKISDKTAGLIGRDAAVGGRLVISCVDMMIDRFLAPHLAAFTAQFPEIELQVDGSLRPANLMQNEAEVVIRISANPHEVLVGTRICDFALAVYRTARQADDQTMPYDWIGWSHHSTADKIMRHHFPDAVPKHFGDNYLTINAMVRTGIGRAMLPCYWADLDAELVREAPELVPAELGLWLLTHPEKRRMARIRAFVDFMLPRLRANRDWFEGRGRISAKSEQGEDNRENRKSVGKE